MPTRDEMSIDERRKYLKLMAERYQQAKRTERSQLLSEMEQVSKLHRKHLIRLLNGQSLERKKRKTPRSRSYGLEVERVVLRVWESLDYICAERLTPSLLWMAKHLASFGTLVLTAEVESQLATISCATVQRMLRKNRARKARLPRTGPYRANQVTKGVPMGRIPWDTKEPGHFEVDLVHHGGQSSLGEYGHTIQLVDVATGWSERVAVLGRAQRAMEAGFERILARVPFELIELHPDNGSEFFNAHLVRYWKEKVVGVKLSRSRPYQKNDNRMVEQKNDTLVLRSLKGLQYEVEVLLRGRSREMPKHVKARAAQDEREARSVRKLARSHHAPADWMWHARMVVESWAGKTPDQTAAELHCHPQTVRVHVERFNQQGIDGLGVQPGSGRKPRLTEAERSVIVALPSQPPPGRLVTQRDGTMVARDESGSAQWSLNALAQAAKEAGIKVKRSQIRTILLKEGVRWRQTHSWGTPRDKDFVPKERRSSPTTPSHPRDRRPSAPMNSDQ